MTVKVVRAVEVAQLPLEVFIHLSTQK